jgi:methionyl-tRNA synthetase
LHLQQVCKKSPRLRDTDHLFLELPLLKDKVEKYINDMSVVGSWSNNDIKITNARLREGLERYCITRDLKWGVPVPHEKYSNKVSFSVRSFKMSFVFSFSNFIIFFLFKSEGFLCLV